MFKNFLKISVSALLLSACQTHWVDERTQNETIRGIVFTQADMYLLGDHADYVFSIKENKKKSESPFDVADFQKFMQLPVRHKITESELSISVVDGREVYLHYEPRFKPALDAVSQQHLKQHQMYAFSGQWMKFSAKGRPVKIENKGQLPPAYLLKTPLSLQVKYKRSESRWNKNAFQQAGGALLAPVLLPAVMVVWGVACIPTMRGNDDGC